MLKLERDLLILGLDPGNVTGFALLNLRGNLIKVGSIRDSSLGEIIKVIVIEGKVFAVSSDVTPLPQAAQKIAKKLSAQLIEPDHKLTLKEKIKMLNGYLKSQKRRIIIKNKHEKDAVVASLYSFKKISPLLSKIRDTLKQKNKLYLEEKIQRKVILENIPIAEAIRQLN